LTEAENFEPKVTLTHVSLSSVELDQLVAETERETVITSQAGPAQGSVIRRS
jgi:hypothetical protein